MTTHIQTGHVSPTSNCRQQQWRMDQSARFPGLNPTEHVGDILQTAIYTRPVQLATVPELQPALLDKRARIPEESIRRLISSIRRWCRAVIRSNGHKMRYYNEFQAPNFIFQKKAPILLPVRVIPIYYLYQVPRPQNWNQNAPNLTSDPYQILSNIQFSAKCQDNLYVI